MPNRFSNNIEITYDDFLALSPCKIKQVVDNLDSLQFEITQQWPFWCRADQREPDGDWRIWLVMAGRGYGKTRMGAEWVNQRARQGGNANARIALVAASIGEARHIMVEGESGILSLHKAEEIDWQPSLKKLTWPNGAQATLYSAAEAESLRGPQHHYAWCDEIAKWSNAENIWNNLSMGLRLGMHPQILATTTPRPVAIIRKLLKQKDVVISKGKSDENCAHLPSDFLESMQELYGGTRLGRQELDGEYIEEYEGALWNRKLLEVQRRDKRPDLLRIVTAVDPPITKDGDECGIIVCGLGSDNKAYMLADYSIGGVSPESWARQVAKSVDDWNADRVVAEANQGGVMVESILRAANINMPVKLVHASHGKVARAEPIAALYEAGRAYHIGVFNELEDQLCGLLSGGNYVGPGRSPDRADALVWAMSELMLGKQQGKPKVRLL